MSVGNPSEFLAIAAAQAIALLDRPTDDPIRAEWNERLGDYLRRRALYDAEDAFGPYRFALDEHECLRRDLEDRFGKGYRAHEGARMELDASWEALSTAEDRNTEEFLSPLWAAARELAKTPAPDLAAALLKVEIIKREETWNDRDLDADAMVLVKSDMVRLAKGD